MDRILVVKCRALGDAVIGLGTISYLKDLFPKAKITYALPQWIVPLFHNAQPERVEIIPIQLKSISGFFRFYKLCRESNPDCIFELQQGSTTGRFFKLFSKLTKVKYYFHNHHIKSPGFILDQGINKPIIQRDLDGVWSGINDLYPEQYAIPNYLDYEPVLSMEEKKTKERRIIIGAVATRVTKMWPLEHYVELCRLILENHKADKVVIPVSNNELDQKVEAELYRLSLPEGAEILKVSLDQLLGEMAKCKTYIGNDTGLKHIAVSLGLKTYTLFGPEPPKEWHPYDKSRHSYFYREGLECRTKNKHFCDLSQCEHLACLNEITPEMVFDRVFR